MVSVSSQHIFPIGNTELQDEPYIHGWCLLLNINGHAFISHETLKIRLPGEEKKSRFFVKDYFSGLSCDELLRHWKETRLCGFIHCVDSLGNDKYWLVYFLLSSSSGTVVDYHDHNFNFSSYALCLAV